MEKGVWLPIVIGATVPRVSHGRVLFIRPNNCTSPPLICLSLPLISPNFTVSLSLPRFQKPSMSTLIEEFVGTSGTKSVIPPIPPCSGGVWSTTRRVALVVPVVALPDLSVIIAEILTVSVSAKPLISSKSGSAVPASSIVIVTESFKSVSSMVYASPRSPKTGTAVVLPWICTVPPTRDVSFATSTFTSSAVLTPFQNPLLTGSVTVVAGPTVKSVGTTPSTTIPGLSSTKFSFAGILKTVIGLPALSRMLAPRSKAMVVTSNGTLEPGDTNQADSSPAATK